MVQREEMYFEPRCVGSDLRIRWYGEQYSAPELERHYEETVYIRDSGKRTDGLQHGCRLRGIEERKR